MDTIFILDAGHGPDTSGKRSPDGSLREYNFNHPTAQTLGTMLNRYDNVQVFYSYTPGQDTSLQTRVARANAIYNKHLARIKAGLTQVFFVSIHANAMGAGGWNSAAGIETFANAPESENPKSKALATDVHRHLIAATRRKDRGVKYMGFYVIKNTDMPAILVECGFMTNEEENGLLKSDSYRTKVAQGICNGLVAHAGLKPAAAAAQPAPVETAAVPVKGATTMSQTPSTSHAEAVEWAVKNGISDGSNPHEPATREQVIAMVYNLFLHLQQDPNAEPFPAHAEAVKWAQEKAISDGSRPLSDATRQQVMQMFYNDNQRKGTL